MAQYSERLGPISRFVSIVLRTTPWFLLPPQCGSLDAFNISLGIFLIQEGSVRLACVVVQPLTVELRTNSEMSEAAPSCGSVQIPRNPLMPKIANVFVCGTP